MKSIHVKGLESMHISDLLAWPSSHYLGLRQVQEKTYTKINCLSTINRN